MPRLNYVGPEPVAGTDLVSRLQGTAFIDRAIVNRSATSAAVEAAAANLAGKDYIDLADTNYVTSDYYQSRDALNVPTSLVGQPNGVATLTGGKIPVAQIPVLGAGYLSGPFGPTSITPASNVGTTPIKIADFVIGVQSVSFQPLGYAIVAVDTNPGGRPVLELRMSNGAANYASQTLIAQGIGRSMFDGRQIVAVTPASATTGASNPTPWLGTTNIVASLWAYSSSETSITIGASAVLSGAIFLTRMVA